MHLVDPWMACVFRLVFQRQHVLLQGPWARSSVPHDSDGPDGPVDRPVSPRSVTCGFPFHFFQDLLAPLVRCLANDPLDREGLLPLGGHEVRLIPASRKVGKREDGRDLVRYGPVVGPGHGQTGHHVCLVVVLLDFRHGCTHRFIGANGPSIYGPRSYGTSISEWCGSSGR